MRVVRHCIGGSGGTQPWAGNGGRVITATALAPTIQEAAVLAKSVIGQVQFEGSYYRKDIGYEFEGVA